MNLGNIGPLGKGVGMSVGALQFAKAASSKIVLRRATTVVAVGLCLTSFGALSACVAGPVSGQSDVGRQLDSPATANSDDSANSGVASKSEGPGDDIPPEALITVDELQALRESGGPLFILDVRSQGQYTGGHIPEARNIPAGKTFDIRMDEVPTDGRTVVLVPQLRERAAEVWQTLVDNGYDGDTIKVLDGGMTAWADDGMDVQVEEDLGC